MQVVDANVLLYAVNADARHHRSARHWLDAALNGTETVGFSWVVVLAFLRLSTNASLFPRPLDPEDAFDVVEAWLGQPPAVVLQPTPRHAGLLRGLTQSTRPGSQPGERRAYGHTGPRTWG